MLTSTDYTIEVFTTAIITLTRLPIYPAISWRVASAFATFTFTYKIQRESTFTRRLTEPARFSKGTTTLLNPDLLYQF